MRPTPAKPIFKAKTEQDAHKEGGAAYKEFGDDFVKIVCPYHYIEERPLYKAWWNGYYNERDKSIQLGRAMR